MHKPERWLPVPGYEGLYEVSNLGQVRSLDRIQRDIAGDPRRYRGRTLKPSKDLHGRRRVILCSEGVRVCRTVAVLVLTAFNGPPPPEHQCCHDDGDASNDRIQNLYWGTQRENNLDTVRHGRHKEANKVTCPRQHLLALPNLTAASVRKGHRKCLACNRARARKQHAEAQGQSFDFVAESHAIYAEIMGSRVRAA